MVDQKVLHEEIGRLFGSALGKEVLDKLVKLYVDVQIASPKDEPAEAYYRQGRADAIKYIRNIVENKGVKQ